jgi:protein ImuA
LSTATHDIVQKLRQDILLLEGYKIPETGAPDIPIGPLAEAFPNQRFPTGKLHEFIAPTFQKAAATGGFVSALAGALMAKGGQCVWITRNRKTFPPGLTTFGIAPDRVVFCDIQKEKHLLWATEEALKSRGLVAVIAEAPDISYTNSLRLQLAIEESLTTGFLLRATPRNTQPIASTARWRVSPCRSRSPIPGLTRVGHPRWTIQLERVRNGHAGIWELEWSAGRLQPIPPALQPLPIEKQHRNTG